MSTKTATTTTTATTFAARLPAFLHAPWVRWMCLLLLCSAYLQGGIDKLLDFDAAIAEMAHFGVAPAAPVAAIVIAGELGASLMILSGIYRWLAAGYLAVFTVVATLVAGRFWEMSGPARFAAENGFFEHLGLAGGLLLVAWLDLNQRKIHPIGSIDTLGPAAATGNQHGTR